MIRKLLLYFTLGLLSLSLCHNALAQSGKYDLHFKHWGQYYFPWEDWHWWKAQGIAESNLNPMAVSSCGAMGVMQLMKGTAKDMGCSNPYDPEQNIQAGIKYDKALYTYWSQIRKRIERRNYTFASYNAGPGWIRKAHNKAGKPQNWDAAAKELPCFTGKRSNETIEYVKRINKFYKQVK